MNISSIRTILISGVAAGALVACAESEVIAINGEIPVTTGTTSTEQSSNGLRFADGEPYEREDNSSPEGTRVYLRVAKLDVTGSGEDAITATAELVDATLFQVWDLDPDHNTTIIVEVDGDRVVFLRSDIGYSGHDPEPRESEQGILYEVTWVASTKNLNAFWAEGYTTDSNWEEVDAFWAYGLETNPADLEGKALATYEGRNFMKVHSTDGDTWAYGPGGIVINADFAGATIDGEMDGVLIASFEGVIMGNGWNADIIESTGAFDSDSYDWTDPDLVALPHNVTLVDGQLDGVFYGATGEETAGTIITKFIAFDGLDAYDFTGAGYFVACEDPILCELSPALPPAP